MRTNYLVPYSNPPRTRTLRKYRYAYPAGHTPATLRRFYAAARNLGAPETYGSCCSIHGKSSGAAWFRGPGFRERMVTTDTLERPNGVTETLVVFH